jgi:ADP-heptose:LPS heptosyltransferase
LQAVWRNDRVQFAKNLPLPGLAALLEHAIFIGHDSGISHLAAAAGAECTLLFGPTDPDVWAPTNTNVRVIRGANGSMKNIGLAQVAEAIAAALFGSVAQG